MWRRGHRGRPGVVCHQSFIILSSIWHRAPDRWTVINPRFMCSGDLGMARRGTLAWHLAVVAGAFLLAAQGARAQQAGGTVNAGTVNGTGGGADTPVPGATAPPTHGPGRAGAGPAPPVLARRRQWHGDSTRRGRRPSVWPRTAAARLPGTRGGRACAPRGLRPPAAPRHDRHTPSDRPLPALVATHGPMPPPACHMPALRLRPCRTARATARG